MVRKLNAYEAISAPCDDSKTAFMISIEPPHYPSSFPEKILKFVQRVRGYYLLFDNKNGIEILANNSESGQLACPVLQPRR